jgi:hypothetical protein
MGAVGERSFAAAHITSRRARLKEIQMRFVHAGSMRRAQLRL